MAYKQFSPLSKTLTSNIPYIAKETENIIFVDTAAIASGSAIQLPDAPSVDGQSWTIKDLTGQADSYNIYVTTVTGTVDIDGAISFLMKYPYESIVVTWSLANGNYSISSAYNETLASATAPSTTFVSSDYTVLVTDDVLLVDASSPVIISLIDSPPVDGQVWTVKDLYGNSLSNGITVTTVGGSVSIDGVTSYLIANNYESASFVWSGSQNSYSVVAEVNPKNVLLPYTDPNTSVGYISLGGTIAFMCPGSFCTFVGLSSGSINVSGGSNTSLGYSSLSSINGGGNNTAVGNNSLLNMSSGSDNVAVGTGSSVFNNGGNQNTSIGSGSLQFSSNDSNNTAIGYFSCNLLNGAGNNAALGDNSLSLLTSGTYNAVLGSSSGVSYTSSESSNILINNAGVAAESNVLRIGAATGNGNQELEAAYICGIDAVDLNTATIVTEDSNQLGTAVLTPGTGITITPGAGIITIAATGGGGSTLTITPIVFADSPYTVLTADQFLAVDVTGGAISILLPNAPATGTVFYVKDSAGLCASSNITVTTVGGSVLIDGATTFVMNTAYESLSVVFDGTTYQVY